MCHYSTSYRNYLYCMILLTLLSCNDSVSKKDNDIVADPRSMDSRIAENINAALKSAFENAGKLDDSSHIDLLQTVQAFYSKNDYLPVWSSTAKWQSMTDSLLQYIAGAETDGLYPND